MFIKKNLLLVFCCSTLVSVKSYTQIISDSISIDSSSQEEYYDASNAVVEYYIGDDIENFRDIDTSLNNFQQFNPARSGRFQQTYLTNIGAATIQKFFVLNRTVGFDHGRNQFDLYKFYVDSVKYYRANTPYTNLFYVLGSKSEQIFAATHTQNFGPQINATIDFKKIASEGSYLHDRKENSNIALSSWYRTKNNIYRIQGAFVHNKINNDENAGVQFDGNVFTQASAFDFNVNRSSTATEWKNFEIQVQQTFDLARKKEYAVNDSTTGFYNEPYLQLTHTFGYHDYDYMFEDLSTDTSYYPGKFVVMDTLRDVSDVDGFYNRFIVSNPRMKVFSEDSAILRTLQWKIFVEQQQHELADPSGNFKFSNLLTGFNLQQAAGNITYFAGLTYDVQNPAYDLNASATYKNEYLQPTVGFRAMQLQPTLLQDYYFGFNNRWENNFSEIVGNEIFLDLRSEKYKTNIFLRYITLHDHVYAVQGIYNNAIPFQFLGNLQILQVVLEKNFQLGDFILRNRIGFQNLDTSIFYLPAFMGNHSWYFEKNLFKSALQLRTGIDVFYTSASKLYQNDIITGMFATGGNETSEFYPWLDVFASFDIRTFRMFLKLENATQGLLGDGYYEAENYPMQSRSFKLGVNWMLYY